MPDEFGQRVDPADHDAEDRSEDRHAECDGAAERVEDPETGRQEVEAHVAAGDARNQQDKAERKDQKRHEFPSTFALCRDRGDPAHRWSRAPKIALPTLT